ncbi:MAG TPA: hypothetical protein VF070_33245 [Streptosporangiaceae bacterium]
MVLATPGPVVGREPERVPAEALTEGAPPRAERLRPLVRAGPVGELADPALHSVSNASSRSVVTACFAEAVNTCTCQGWQLELLAEQAASLSSRSTSARGTGIGRNARQLRRVSSASSIVRAESMMSPSIAVLRPLAG